MRNPELITEDGVQESLSSLYQRDTCSVIRIKDTVEESATGSELAAKLNRLKLFSKFTLDRETPEYARLVTTDCFGNRHYLLAEKS